MPCILSVRDIAILYPVGTVTMDTFRRQEIQKRDELILYKMVLRSWSLSKLLNVNQTLDQLVTEGCSLLNIFVIY